MNKQDLLHLNSILNRIQAIYKDYARLYHIPHTSFSILYALCVEEKPLTQKEIQEYLFAPKQTIHSSLHALEKQGYVYLHHADKSKKYYALTKEGTEYCASTIAKVVQAEEEVLQSFSDKDRELYFQFEDRYRKEFEKKVKEIL